MPKHKAEVAIVGAGILGLAHAYAAALRGRSVIVFERNARARGASVRNFGMIWPIGQPSGGMHQMALRSRELWLEVLDRARLPCLPTGSLHVAYRNDEADVAREFSEIAQPLGYDCEWLSPEGVLARSQAVCPAGLRGGLWSPTELAVDPRLVLAQLPLFLGERYAVEFRYGCPVRTIDSPVVEAGTERWEVERVIVCTGDDFETLYPAEFQESGMIRCKLQMMRTAPQPDGWQLGPSLAAGLTLRFYTAFQICRTLAVLKERIARETPEYDEWGIHGLVSQTACGELTLGDSHEYGKLLDVFDKPAIDDLILRYLRTFLVAPSLAIAQRWHGTYAKHPDKPFVALAPSEGVRVVSGVGGAGMTLSFGLAEQSIHDMGI